MTRRDPPKVKELKAGMKVPAYVHECQQCAELFLARKDARFCSNACRMASKRAAKHNERK